MKQIRSTMAGIIVEIPVKTGQMVAEGSEIALLESMKMQIPVLATASGKVSQVHVVSGDFVNEGDPILTLE